MNEQFVAARGYFLQYADGDKVFELVADEDGVVVGHIFYSRLWADSVNMYAALAPMAVAGTRSSAKASAKRAAFSVPGQSLQGASSAATSGVRRGSPSTSARPAAAMVASSAA